MQTIIRQDKELDLKTLKNTLTGALYPLSKSDVIELAELNFADAETLEVLSYLGDSYYYSLSDIKQEIQYILNEEDDNRNDLFASYFNADNDDDVIDEENEVYSYKNNY